MDMKPPRVATINGDAELDHAIATLVLAFGTDPVARWMYGDPINIYSTSLDYSEPLEQARSQQEERSAPSTVLASRSGFRVFTAMMVRSTR